MQAQLAHHLDLTPFRRRIRLLRCWYCAGIGGAIGAIVSILIAMLDYFGWRYVSPWQLAIPVVCGLVAGVMKALLEGLPDARIAQSLDRRANLEDRLTTASEIAPESGSLAEAQHQDALRHLTGLKPRDLYRLRLNRWHGILVACCLVSALIFVLANTALLKTGAAKQEAEELKRISQEVAAVAKPVLEEAKKADATEADKELARRLEQFTAELNKARLSKPEALLKANQLSEEAKKLQQPRIEAMAASLQKAQTAAAQLEKLAQKAQLEKSDAQKTAEQMNALQKEIDEMERKLQGQGKGKDEKSLTPQEKAALEKKLADAKKRLQDLKLSEQAQRVFEKLQSLPEYKEAQELLSKLAQAAAQQQAGEMSEMTQEQLEAAAKRLEELAKKLDTDEKLKQFAKELLEAAMKAKACKGGNCAGGLMSAFGLGSSAGGLSLGGQKGAGAPSNDRWVGAHGELHKDDKSSLLDVKLEDRVIRSQIGDKGAQTYVEVTGPSQLGKRSAIPYQNALPKYQKSAESALNKTDIPPRLRGKVRDYFDSLRK